MGILRRCLPGPGTPLIQRAWPRWTVETPRYAPGNSTVRSQVGRWLRQNEGGPLLYRDPKVEPLFYNSHGKNKQILTIYTNQNVHQKKHVLLR